MNHHPEGTRKFQPIAETYHELQALQHIDRVFEVLEVELSDGCATSVYEGAVSAALFLILVRMNIELERFEVERAEGESDSARSELARRLPWIERSFLLAVEIIEEHGAHKFHAKNCVDMSVEIQKLEINYSKLSYICESLGVFEIFTAEFGSVPPNDKIEDLLHNLSLTAHRIESILFFCRKVSGKLRNSELNSEIYKAARGGNVVSAGSNLLDFFRLFHQVPEILGRSAVKMIDLRLSSDDIDAKEVPVELRVLISHVRSIRMCLTPLSSLMTPREYYLIRHQLGNTSGSHSKILARKGLLRSRLEKLIMKFQQFPKYSNEEVLAFLQDLEFGVLVWRRDHLFFPRFLLGSGGTASLSRAPDGLENCRSMGLAVHQRVGLIGGQARRGFGIDYAAAFDTSDGQKSLGGRISGLIGDIARKRFDYVQRDSRASTQLISRDDDGE